MAAKPAATKPSRHATKHDHRDKEIARLTARVAELEQVMAASQERSTETKKDRTTKPTWISLPEAIMYVATKSERAQAWALKRFKRRGAPERPFFDDPIASDVVKGLSSEGYGLSLQGDAIDAIEVAAREGKLTFRGVSFVRSAEWANLEISAEGEVLRGLVVAYQDVAVELRGLRRHFPQSSGRGGTQLAELRCRGWLRRLKPRPVRRKAACGRKLGAGSELVATPSYARGRHLPVKNGNGEGGHANRPCRGAGDCRNTEIRPPIQSASFSLPERMHAPTMRGHVASRTPRLRGRARQGEGHMRNRPKSHVTFQARISPEAERVRRRLQRQSGESNGTLVERAFRKLEACPDEAPEQPPEAAA
jgi:hypothetical protein